MSNPRKIRFAKYDTVGDPSAESDGDFLSTCFVDNGSLSRLRSCEDPRGIVVGRTGTGKTALLLRLSDTEEHVVTLDPHDIALKHLADSTIIRFFESLGVNMDLFYQALWRHVFVVELIKMRFGLESEDDKVRAIDQMRLKLFRKKQHLRALEYLTEFGSRFWETTEERIKEVTRKVESELKTAGGVNIGELARATLDGTSRLTEEQRREFIEHGNEVVNRLQLSQLTLLMDGLDEEVFTDPEKHYFVVIDRLDENWADDAIRYKLIRALIETMRHINSKVRHAKAIVVLRTDLLDRVLRATTDSGFQDEKYRSLCLHVTWNRDDLVALLDARISQLVRRRYAHKEAVTHAELLPNRIGPTKQAAIEYMLDRTLMRPRDLITFFNLCMANSEGEATIRPHKLLETEGQYSQERLRSIGDEWCVHYPHLDLLCKVLEKRRACFKLGDLSEAELDSICLQVVDGEQGDVGEDARALHAYLTKQLTAEGLRTKLAQILFRAGVVGLKTSSYTGTQWSIGTLDKVPSVAIDDDTTVEVHKTFWRALGIKP